MNSLLRGALGAAVCLTLSTAPALASGKVIGPALPPLLVEGLEPLGKYRVLVDGTPAKKQKVAVSAKAGSIYLLQAEELGHGLLIRPRERDIVRLPEGAVRTGMDGTFVVDVGGPGDVVGPFEVDDDGLLFAFDDHEVRLGAAPILLGDRSTDELLEKQAGYAFRAGRFVPRSAALQALATAPDGVRVKTFFGSWCGACSQKLPRLLRIAQDLRGRKMKFEYYGLPSPFKGEPEATKYKVASVPTAVVLLGDTELGRIVGDDWIHPADTLRKILEKTGKL
jgi:thiol-disulfide isomerase/thioredoxin